MVAHTRQNWSKQINQVIRSHHYSWLAEGLSGLPLEDALVDITTDILHICKRQGISWETVLSKSQALYEREERRATELAEAQMGS